uniref:Zinc finger Ran-binding domain-containing protein 2 n=1 Tax=Globodera pallida TaxID=36090 RepID=A0A183BMR8_GLOPA
MIDDESSSSKIPPNRPALKEGEWACVDAKCAQINSDKRRHCQKCGKDKPRAKQKIGREIGKEAAEKSKGLFAAEDWVCTKCGNVNWARRIMCNVCNAPKLADLEVRTGYGGGYMDREDVEYIQRDDDEEFDEFGRKKKRRGMAEFLGTKGVVDEDIDEERKTDEEEEKEEEEEEEHVGIEDELEVKERKEEKDEEEEEKIEDEEDEDDDEGDEADLDKYDLSADPELASLTIDLLKRRAQGGGGVADSKSGDGKRSQSVASSDCSCSCSGGECSCVESEEE